MWARKLEPNDLRDRLIDAALAHVPFDGWSQAAVVAGAADIGEQQAVAEQAFSGRPLELVCYHAALADRRMVEAISELDLDVLKIRAKIAAAVRIRLAAASPHKEAVRAALSVLAAPTSAPAALSALYGTVDAIWSSIGDTSTDFNYYSKRALLAGVYVSTLMYWLNDQTENDTDTWAFLDRRIADVMQIQGLKGRLARQPLPVQDVLRQLRRVLASGRPRRETWRAGTTETADTSSEKEGAQTSQDDEGTSGASSSP